MFQERMYSAQDLSRYRLRISLLRMTARYIALNTRRLFTVTSILVWSGAVSGVLAQGTTGGNVSTEVWQPSSAGSYVATIVKGRSDAICRMVLDAAKQLGEAAIGQCEPLNAGEIKIPSLTPHGYFRWDLIRENLPKTVTVPNWQQLDLQNTADLEAALLAKAILDLRIDRSDGTTVAWAKAFTDDQIRKIINQYVHTGKLPTAESLRSDYVNLRENNLKLTEKDEFYVSELKTTSYDKIVTKYLYSDGSFYDCSARDEPNGLARILYRDQNASGKTDEFEMDAHYISASDYLLIDGKLIFVTRGRSSIGFQKYSAESQNRSADPQKFPGLCTLSISGK